MSTKTIEDEKKSNAPEILGAAFSNDFYTKDGEKIKTSKPWYNVSLDAEKVKVMQPSEEGYIKFSIRELKDASLRKQENKPSCYVVANPSSASFKDKYAVELVTVKKEDLLSCNKVNEITRKEELQVNINVAGKIFNAQSNLQLEGLSVSSSIETQEQKQETNEDIAKYVGIAFEHQAENKESNYYNLVIDIDAIKNLPIDNKGNVRLSIHERKDVQEGKASHSIVPSAHSGVIDKFSVKDLYINKEQLMQNAKSEKIGDNTINKTFARISVNNTIYIPFNKETKEDVVFIGKGFDVDRAAREKMIEEKKEKSQNASSDTKQKENKSEKAEPAVRKARGLRY